jgi:D-alanine-D-alanine ligase
MVCRVTSDPAPSARIRIAVVFGGRSSEHPISCISGGAVLAALDPARYDVTAIGITRKGRWVSMPADPALLTAEGGELPEVKDGAGVVLAGDPMVPGLRALDTLGQLDQLAQDQVAQGEATPADGAAVSPSTPSAITPSAAASSTLPFDVVFPVLHGRYGEDGTIQGLLEMADVPYVGSGVLASAAAMDKEITKKLLAAAGLDVGTFAVLRPGETLSQAERERLGLPVFVKPARAGSSIGITKVAEWAELDAALATARKHDSKVLVEAAVVGREVECGVLAGEDGGEPEASVPAEIRLVGEGHDWYDFEAKYLDDVCEFDVPADLRGDAAERLQAAARRAFTALDCAGLARVDFFIRPDGSLVVNEVNTMPGFTPISMFPRMWAASGLDFGQLVDRLIRTALLRDTGPR